MRVTPSRGGGPGLGVLPRRRPPQKSLTPPRLRVRRFWPQVFVAQWAGGTVLLLILVGASALGLAPQDLPGDAAFAPWPVTGLGAAVAAAAWGTIVAVWIALILQGFLTLRRPPSLWALAVAVAVGGYVPLALSRGLSGGDPNNGAAIPALMLTSVLVRVAARRAARMPPRPPVRRLSVAIVLLGALVLVIPWAAFHPVQTSQLDLMDHDGGSSSIASSATTTVGPRRRVSIGVTVQTAAAVKLLDVRPAVPRGLRVIDYAPEERAPALPRTLRRGQFQSPAFSLVLVGCPTRPLRVDAVRVRFVRLGVTITQRLPVPAPLTVRCRRGAGPIR